MNILKMVFLCLVFILCYLILYRVYILRKSRRLEKSEKKLILNNEKMTIAFAFIIFVISAYTYKSIICGALYGTLGLMIPKFYKRLMGSIEKRKTLIDLLSVTESLGVQLTSNMPLKLILKNLPDVCKYKKFKDAMIDYILNIS
jgi:hypothetical protein